MPRFTPMSPDSIADIFVGIWDALTDEKRAATLADLERAAGESHLLAQVRDVIVLTNEVVENSYRFTQINV